MNFIFLNNSDRESIKVILHYRNTSGNQQYDICYNIKHESNFRIHAR